MSKVVIGNAELYQGDCLEVMRGLPDNSVDSVVTDPPYGLRFMNRHWDYDVPTQAVWEEVLRILKPGGHVLSFAGSRTYHRMTVAIEDAGFEIRDQIMWLYGSGFPKSLDISKALDKMAGAERVVIINPLCEPTPRSDKVAQATHTTHRLGEPKTFSSPATEAARQWSGWGTALKPAHEPICLARKPLIGTIAENVLAHGTGGLNIDASRIATDGEAFRTPQSDPTKREGEVGSDLGISKSSVENFQAAQRASIDRTANLGRWPANIIHDGSDEVLAVFPETGPSPKQYVKKKGGWLPPGSTHEENGLQSREYGDTGSAARFFYCAKASRSDRGEGNKHPTVKPTELMRYLCRLITPPGGTVLDPFMGSGSTGKGCLLEGFRFIGIEREAEYLEIAAARLRKAQQQPNMFNEPKPRQAEQQASA